MDDEEVLAIQEDGQHFQNFLCGIWWYTLIRPIQELNFIFNIVCIDILCG